MDYRKDDDILSTFRQELEDHLSVIESGILTLEKASPVLDDELIHAMFRSAHSIKAGANLLDYKNIEALSHTLENTLQHIRYGDIALENDLIELVLEGVDLMSEMSNHLELSDKANVTPVIFKLNNLLKK